MRWMKERLFKTNIFHEDDEEKWIGENGNFYFEKEYRNEEYEVYFNNACVRVTPCDIPPDWL